MRFLATCTLAIFAMSSMGHAADKVKIPEAAKLLNKDEIIAFYGGKMFSWAHPNTDKGKGTTTFDPAKSTIGGTYDIGGNKGEWEGKITWKGDQYCFQTRGKGQKKYSKVECNLIYLDGTTAYEVDPKSKKVKSVNTPM